MYTLYYSPGSASMVVHLALLEIGLPYELKLVDFSRRAQTEPAYLKLNPQGVVPTLIIDGVTRTESAALLIMLAERHPQAGLIPALGTPEHDEWHQWVAYMSNSLASTFRLWFYPGDLGATIPEASLKAGLQQRIEAIWDRLDMHLRAHGPYLVSGRFSGADLMLTMLMRWSRKMPRPATQWAALKVLADNVRARPSWKKLYELEGLQEWY
jgi:glutathione S-transferase